MVNQLAYKDVIVRAKDIPSYCNEEFFEVLGYYHITKMWGLPNGTLGWANEPAVLMDALILLENEENLWQEEKRKKDEEKSKLKARGSRGRRRH